jgi:hypothetical protein
MVNIKYPKSKYSQNIRLTTKQTSCPYCRQVFNVLLPHIPLYNISLPKHICSNTKCFELKPCSYQLKSGKFKGSVCGNKHGFKTTNGVFCIKHCSPQEVTFVNEQAKEMYKNSTVQELKQRLRDLNLSMSGRKHVLANRIISHKPI